MLQISACAERYMRLMRKRCQLQLNLASMYINKIIYVT